MARGLLVFQAMGTGLLISSTFEILWRDNYLVIGKIWFGKNKCFRLSFV